MQAYSIKGIAFKKELDQDALIIRNDLENPIVIICDGHGNKLGRNFANEIAKIGMQSVPKEIEISQEYAKIIAENFKDKAKEKYEEYCKRYEGCGTTFLMVIFSEDYRKYIVVKLGDSYVVNVPDGFEGDGTQIAYDMVECGGKWMNTMSPMVIWKAYQALDGVEKRRLGENGIGWVNYCYERFGSYFGALGNAFRRDNVAISTMGLEPDLVKDGDDIGRCLDEFIRYDCVDVPDGCSVVVASDGLPIHRGAMWRNLMDGRLVEWLEEVYGGRERDDCTVVVVKMS